MVNCPNCGVELELGRACGTKTVPEMLFSTPQEVRQEQDPMFKLVLRWLVREENTKRIASIAGTQRQFAIGFGRAGRIFDQLCGAGYISKDSGAGAREVLVSREEVEKLFGKEE